MRIRGIREGPSHRSPGVLMKPDSSYIPLQAQLLCSFLCHDHRQEKPSSQLFSWAHATSVSRTLPSRRPFSFFSRPTRKHPQNFTVNKKWVKSGSFLDNFVFVHFPNNIRLFFCQFSQKYFLIISTHFWLILTQLFINYSHDFSLLILTEIF